MGGLSRIELLRLRTPRPATRAFRAFRAFRARGVPGSVPHGSVPKNGGSPTECPMGCLQRLFGPRAPEFPKSVLRVSPECQKGVQGHSGDTLGTLRGHSRARGRKGPGDTPWDTASETPSPSQRHSAPKGPKGSCSWPGSLQC